jgi:hypothetical protein
MSELSPIPENNNLNGKQTLSGLFRVLTGGLIGIIFFATLISIALLAKSAHLIATLMSPGFWLMVILGLLIPAITGKLVGHLAMSISGIPYAILGSLIFSKTKPRKIIGIISLAIFWVLSIIAGEIAIILFPD